MSLAILNQIHDASSVRLDILEMDYYAPTRASEKAKGAYNLVDQATVYA